MQYMGIVIVKGDFKDKYGNNAIWIDFSTLDNIINALIEGSYCSICATSPLSG